MDEFQKRRQALLNGGGGSQPSTSQPTNNFEARRQQLLTPSQQATQENKQPSWFDQAKNAISGVVKGVQDTFVQKPLVNPQPNSPKVPLSNSNIQPIEIPKQNIFDLPQFKTVKNTLGNILNSQLPHDAGGNPLDANGEQLPMNITPIQHLAMTISSLGTPLLPLSLATKTPTVYEAVKGALAGVGVGSGLQALAGEDFKQILKSIPANAFFGAAFAGKPIDEVTAKLHSQIENKQIIEKPKEVALTPEVLKNNVIGSDLNGTPLGEQLLKVSEDAQNQNKDVKIVSSGGTTLEGTTPQGNKIKYEFVEPTKIQPLNDLGQPIVQDTVQATVQDKTPSPITETPLKVTKAASDINTTLAKKGFESLPPEELAKYTPVKKAEQIKNISDLMTTDIEKAKSIAKGSESVPGNILPQPLFNAVEQHAMKTEDIQLLRDLARSPLATQLSEAGQTLGSHGFNDTPNSPVQAIRQVVKAREISIEKKTGKSINEATKATVAKISQEIQKAAPNKNEWYNFIKEIQC